MHGAARHWYFGCCGHQADWPVPESDNYAFLLAEIFVRLWMEKIPAGHHLRNGRTLWSIQGLAGSSAAQGFAGTFVKEGG